MLVRQSPGSRSHRPFLERQLIQLALSLGVLAFSLGLGMWGYEHYENLPWRDAFLNSAMLLGGMGPIELNLSESGKLFAGLYALYCGLVVIAVTGLLLAPGIHHLMHRVHWEEPKAQQ
jgi:magnesium-transporting ATPase (P-type)